MQFMRTRAHHTTEWVNQRIYHGILRMSFSPKVPRRIPLDESERKSIITCPNWEYTRDIETFISPDLFKDTTNSSVDFRSQTFMDVDTDVLLTNELGMLDEEVQTGLNKKTGGKKESDKLKKFIKELSFETSQSLEVMEEGAESFFDLKALANNPKRTAQALVNEEVQNNSLSLGVFDKEVLSINEEAPIHHDVGPAETLRLLNSNI
ncbi:hypothetical protein C1646_751790 [Rhizophagus diaphanus]|nr:hypothetical protein C1646_751790 [Rhizophagus diaphanus] [Rhizophagus sp. MUCL 43196]